MRARCSGCSALPASGATTNISEEKQIETRTGESTVKKTTLKNIEQIERIDFTQLEDDLVSSTKWGLGREFCERFSTTPNLRLDGLTHLDGVLGVPLWIFLELLFQEVICLSPLHSSRGGLARTGSEVVTREGDC